MHGSSWNAYIPSLNQKASHSSFGGLLASADKLARRLAPPLPDRTTLLTTLAALQE
jgi:hypothetical protein